MWVRTAWHRHVQRAPAIIAYASIIGLAGSARTDPEFMTYDAVERLVRLTVTAGYDRTNSGYNLNGGFNGSHRITVPLGWRVEVAFVNRDVIPHSLGVVRERKLLPIRIEKPEVPGAATRGIMTGIPKQASSDFAFVATLPGPYLLACGVPGHAAIGSYLRFVVAADIPVPTYEGAATVALAKTRD